MFELHNLIHHVSRFLYFIIAIAISSISLLLVAYGFREVVEVMLDPTKNIIDHLLDAIGIVVISLALFDVTKYLVEEEVLPKNSRPKTHEDFRLTLIKFLTILSIAVCLEALIFIFRAGKTDVTQLLYPIALLLAGVAVVLSLGVFIRISKDKHERLND